MFNIIFVIVMLIAAAFSARVAMDKYDPNPVGWLYCLTFILIALAVGLGLDK